LSTKTTALMTILYHMISVPKKMSSQLGALMRIQVFRDVTLYRSVCGSRRF